MENPSFLFLGKFESPEEEEETLIKFTSSVEKD